MSLQIRTQHQKYSLEEVYRTVLRLWFARGRLISVHSWRRRQAQLRWFLCNNFWTGFPCVKWFSYLNSVASIQSKRSVYGADWVLSCPRNRFSKMPFWKAAFLTSKRRFSKWRFVFWTFRLPNLFWWTRNRIRRRKVCHQKWACFCLKVDGFKVSCEMSICGRFWETILKCVNLGCFLPMNFSLMEFGNFSKILAKSF